VIRQSAPSSPAAVICVSSSLPNTALLSEHLLHLLNILRPSLGALIDNPQIRKMDFFCGIFGDNDWITRVEISDDIIRQCVSSKIDLSLDFYRPNALNSINLPSDDDDNEIDVHYSFAFVETRIETAAKDFVERTGSPYPGLLPLRSYGHSVLLRSALPETRPPIDHIRDVISQMKELQFDGASGALSCVLLFTSDCGQGGVTLEHNVLEELSKQRIQIVVELHQPPQVLARQRTS
jgi:hypothetical protein